MVWLSKTLRILLCHILFVLLNAINDGSNLNTDGSETVATTSPVIPKSTSQSVTDNATVHAVTDRHSTAPVTASEDNLHLELCPSNVSCSLLGGDCITCQFNKTCNYGSMSTAVCEVKPDINCTGNRTFSREYNCRYCYQLDHWHYSCNSSTTCSVGAPPHERRYIALCTVRDSVLCMGRRRFYKYVPCNWTSGYKWSTALVLSITLGGFGADRFYLGLWREGIGKLFSFGGLGVWTLVDVILIGVGYVGPADGSLYI